MHPDRKARLPHKVAALADPPNFPKKALFEESDSDSDDGGAAVESGDFKVNSEYAKRFEHNKKREERQRRTYLKSYLNMASQFLFLLS
jgi:hypothetical protein